MTQLGGHALYIDWRTTNFALADISDELQYLSRNVDCIMARLLCNSDLLKMAAASRVPVINGCDEKYHPSQALADLITIKEKRGNSKAPNSSTSASTTMSPTASLRAARKQASN